MGGFWEGENVGDLGKVIPTYATQFGVKYCGTNILIFF